MNDLLREIDELRSRVVALEIASFGSGDDLEVVSPPESDEPQPQVVHVSVPTAFVPKWESGTDGNEGKWKIHLPDGCVKVDNDAADFEEGGLATNRSAGFAELTPALEVWCNVTKSGSSFKYKIESSENSDAAYSFKVCMFDSELEFPEEQVTSGMVMLGFHGEQLTIGEDSSEHGKIDLDSTVLQEDEDIEVHTLTLKGDTDEEDQEFAVLSSDDIEIEIEQADWNEDDSTSKAYINNKPTIPAAANNAKLTIKDNGGSELGSFTANASEDVSITLPSMPEQVQADWNEDDSTSKAYINNKPTTKTLREGDNITLSESNNVITISASAGGASSGLTDEIIVLSDVSYDSSTHVLKYTCNTLTFVNGILTNISDDSSVDITTAVEES